MSQESVERFLGRLITDDDFREQLQNQKSFYKTCREGGFKLTDGEENILRRIDFAQFASLADSLDQGIRRMRSQAGTKDSAQTLKHL
jgi:hypothetical protein